MPILKKDMSSIQKTGMTLVFIDFDFPPIYKADSGGSWTFSFELPHDKTNKLTATSEDSDQPGNPPILIRIFAVRSVGS